MRQDKRSAETGILATETASTEEAGGHMNRGHAESGKRS
jgi:hypothetical protein